MNLQLLRTPTPKYAIFVWYHNMCTWPCSLYNHEVSDTLYELLVNTWCEAQRQPNELLGFKSEPFNRGCPSSLTRYYSVDGDINMSVGERSNFSVLIRGAIRRLWETFLNLQIRNWTNFCWNNKHQHRSLVELNI